MVPSAPSMAVQGWQAISHRGPGSLKARKPFFCPCLECKLITFFKYKTGVFLSAWLCCLSLPSARTDERFTNNRVSCLQSWLHRLMEVICPLINYIIFSPFVVLNRWTSFLLPATKCLGIIAPLSFLSGFWAHSLSPHMCVSVCACVCVRVCMYVCMHVWREGV